MILVVKVVAVNNSWEKAEKVIEKIHEDYANREDVELRVEVENVNTI